MPQFRYVARSAQGGLQEGVLESSDRSAAIRQVEKSIGFPVKIEPLADGASGKPATPSQQPSASQTTAPRPHVSAAIATSALSMSYAQQHLFTEQLALLLGAGMTLDEALGILERRMKHPKLQGLAKGLHTALVEGRSLSQALREYPKIFSPLYINMVAAGEASGTLGEILKRLVSYLGEVKEIRDKVQQALAYPALLVVMGVAMVTLFMTVMVPKLIKFFADTNQELPFATQMLIKVHGLFTSYWWVGIVASAGSFFAFNSWTASAAGRRQWDNFRWHFPAVGGILRQSFYSKFARTLATLVNNGVTLLRALQLTEDIAGNTFVYEKMKAAQQRVVDGVALSGALAQQEIFPELFVDMLAVGEQSGRLGETLGNIADLYDRELNKQVQFVSTLIPPLVLIVIAIVIGFVVLGILSGVFSMTRGFQGGAH